MEAHVILGFGVLSHLAAVKSTTQDKETTFILNSNTETQRTGKTQSLTLTTASDVTFDTEASKFA